MKLISLVFPFLNEEENLHKLYDEVVQTLQKESADIEFIFVDDGSTDRSVEIVKVLRASDPRVKFVSLSRNFGHQMALTAGLDHAQGDAVIVMDSDLQHPPTLLPKMIALWEEGNEVVFTIRKSSWKEGVFKRITSFFFYRLLRMLTDIDIPMDAADFRLMDRKVVDALKQVRERARFLRGLTAWTGFRSTSIPYTASDRWKGKSKYTIGRMFRLAIDGAFSFSTFPLYASIYLGLALGGFGLLYAGYAIYIKLFTDLTLQGWTSTVLLLSLIGGIQLLVLGIVGIYIGRIYEETKQRPLYLTREVEGFDRQS